MDIMNLLYTFKARKWLLVTQGVLKHSFGKMGKHTRILSPTRIANCKYIKLGNNVYIDTGVYMTADDSGNSQPNIEIMDGVKLGNFNHIACVESIVIEKNVLTADRVYISDNMHIYMDIDSPIKSQGIMSKGSVIIGENSWIGDNVAIVSCRIGKNCVIGANSFVNSDIPDYSVAVGCPARVVKRYNFEERIWEKI